MDDYYWDCWHQSTDYTSWFMGWHGEIASLLAFVMERK